jgi:hypothetical protein
VRTKLEEGGVLALQLSFGEDGLMTSTVAG